MVLLKIGENIEIQPNDIRPTEAIINDAELHDRFKKIANNIKKIAPRAEDFVYFTAIMMHAAERSLYDDDGNLKKNADGSVVWAKWEEDSKTGSLKWVCSDPNIFPYKNNNGDIFPEMELKKAYKLWVGKPLCQDHQSNSTDGIRGLILDTYWDDKHKRIVSLNALDKVNYPELARKVSARYATNVSMGTGVGRSICYNCGNVATTEKEYCNCVRSKTSYGEINRDLAPIELSVVVNGADRDAQVMQILAHTKEFETRLSKVGSSMNTNELKTMRKEFERIAEQLSKIENENESRENDNNLALKEAASYNSDIDLIKNKINNLESMLQSIANRFSTEDSMSDNISKKSYFQGTEEPTPGKPKYPKEPADQIRDDEAKANVQDLGPVDGLPAKDLEVKKLHSRAEIEERRQLRAQAVAKAKKALSDKIAYPQGTEPPKTYPVDPGNSHKDFKFNNDIKDTGSMGDDAKVKEKLNRASLKAKLVKAAKPGDNRWQILADDKVVMSVSFNELTGGKESLYPAVATTDFAKSMLKKVLAHGADKASNMFKSAQDPMAAPPAPAPVAPTAPPVDAAPTQNLIDVTVVVEAFKELSSVLQKLVGDLEGGSAGLANEDMSDLGNLPDEVQANPDGAVESALADLTSQNPQSTTASLNKLRIVMNAALQNSFASSLSKLKASKHEVDLLLTTASNSKEVPSFLKDLAKDVAKDATANIREAKKLKGAFVKYAQGTEEIHKRAKIEQMLSKKAQEEVSLESEPSADELDVDELFSGLSLDSVTEDSMLGDSAEKGVDEPMVDFDTLSEELDMGNDKTASNKYDMNTVEGRRAFRAKLAASAKTKFSDMLSKAHPKGGTSVGDIAAPTGDLAKVETLEETNAKMHASVATQPKAKQAAKEDENVKLAATHLNNLIVSGKVSVADLGELIEKKGLDKDVVSYWKKYYGQTDGGSEFAAALLKDYESGKAPAKKADDESVVHAKLAKAYDLAYQMADVGLIPRQASKIREKAEEAMSYSDAAFSSVRRIVASHQAAMTKKASLTVPQVGMAKEANSHDGSSGEWYDMLSAAFAGRKY